MTLRQHAIVALGLLGVVVWAFWSLRWAGFVYEDTAWQALGESGRQTFSVMTPRWLFWRSWQWQQRTGQSALAFHLLSLGLHLTVAGLAGLLTRRLGYGAVAVWTAIAIVALHPLAREGAVYLSARAELIATIGLLLACVIGVGRWSGLQVLGVGVALALGVSGKETAAAAIVLIPLLRRNWMGVAIMMGVLLALVLPYAPIGVTGDTGPLTAEIAQRWALQQATAGARMLGMLVNPWPDRSSIDYDYGHVAIGLQLAVVLGWAMWAVVAWAARERYPELTIGMLGILVIVIPRVIVYTPRSWFNEHQMYGAVPWFALLVAAAVDKLERKGLTWIA